MCSWRQPKSRFSYVFPMFFKMVPKHEKWRQYHENHDFFRSRRVPKTTPNRYKSMPGWNNPPHDELQVPRGSQKCAKIDKKAFPDIQIISLCPQGPKSDEKVPKATFKGKLHQAKSCFSHVAPCFQDGAQTPKSTTV